MYDASFSARSLMYVFRKQDYRSYDIKNIEEVKVRLLQAENYTKSIESSLKFNIAHTKGRALYFPQDYETEIIIRKANTNIKKILGINPVSRNDIIRHLKEILREGVPYVIGRYDIKRFYDNIKISALNQNLDESLSTTYDTRRLVSGFLSSHEALYSSGLPTGISLSATLSELYLRNFDRGIKALPWVRYFARYVDDIIIIAEPRTTAQLMESALISGLPDGLALNSGKDKRYFRKLERDFGGAGPEADFDYLGYRFKVDKILKKSSDCGTLASRKVTVDISEKKVKIRKTRFIYAVHKYLADANFQDLKNRFRILNSGHIYYDKTKNRYRRTGIMYSYPLIDFPSSSLNSIEKLYRTIFTKRYGPICSLLSHSPLSRSERKYFLSHSLEKTVREGVHIDLKPAEVVRLMECWKHV
ncbi:antiviral reverse transcriptase Drt3a [Brucella anthropi]|nr:antiviral reverse transcriptase Drt3a [Brucella anthropi]AIK43599.1 reverse transcriptase family protein [Brucella anthropi]KAB2753134.1 RNA-directed DNA polymerase [Brucella anthropi]KAB2784015.1 RNA-directed DNA polymerase [Brucella anthropi]QQC25550.1 RNA-directed DNA polymerase [Brucella anthropi]SUA66221.1 Retron-type reverse transcriptase [Brucella anthropi]